MRVIDLLNKIASGEEVPKKFKYKGEIYIYRTYTFEDGDVMTGYGFEDGGWLNIWRDNLNDEVEIIEEDKKIERMSDFYEEQINENGLMSEPFNKHELKIINKINEIIDYIMEDKNE